MPLRTYGAKDGRAYYEEQAMAIREACGLPLILVGGLRELDQCRRLHEQGVADYLSLSRPLIREPGLVSRWRSGDTSPATCISCNGCLKAAIKGQGMYCVLDAS